MKKPSTQTIVIVILSLIILGFAYSQWGRGFLSSLKYKFSGQEEKDKLQIGDINASLRIIEYYSYSCEYCKIFDNEIKPMIIKNYISDGSAKWIFRPVDVGLGDAVLCANEQGKFLEYHDSLFRNVVNIQKEEDLKQLAKNVGINEEEFWRCYSSGKYTPLIVGWYNELMANFRKYKIAESERGTPAFLIGDKMITGVQPYSSFVELIEEKLAK